MVCGRCREVWVLCGGGNSHVGWVRGCLLLGTGMGWVMAVGLGKGVKNRVLEYGLVIV